jgi:hypothetical protein
MRVSRSTASPVRPPRAFQSQRHEKRPPTEAASLLSYRASDFCAATLTDVNHLNQAIGEFDRLACFRFHRSVFFCRHPAPTARTDHNWLFWARPHASEINPIKQTCQSGKIGQYRQIRTEASGFTTVPGIAYANAHDCHAPTEGCQLRPLSVVLFPSGYLHQQRK